MLGQLIYDIRPTRHTRHGLEVAHDATFKYALKSPMTPTHDVKDKTKRATLNTGRKYDALGK